MCCLVPFVDGAGERITREHNRQVRLSMAEQGSRLDQRALTRKAHGADRNVRTSQPMPQSNMTGRSVGQAFRKRTGVGPGPSIYGSALVEGFSEFGAAESSTEHHGHAGPVHLAQVDAGILNGQGRSHQGPCRQSIKTPCLQPRHHIGGAKRLHQKCSSQSGGWPCGDGFGFKLARWDQSGERTIRTHRTDTRNGSQVRSHEGPLPNPLLPNMSAVLLPPNPAETDIASGSGWCRTPPRSQFTLGLSMGSVSRSVGSSAPRRTAIIVMTASSAPAAPRQCPKYDFVEETGTGWLRPLKAAS